METRPLCSVIIPCYNQGGYLPEAVESVRASAYPNLEIIVVDDGSTDPETVRMLENLPRGPRLRILRQENQGLAGARNAGIRHAGGKYILPLDADDRIHPQFIAKAVEVLERREEVGIVGCNVEFFGDRSGRYFLPPFRFPGILLRNAFVCSSVFRRSDWAAVGGYRRNMVFGGEDWDFWISIVELGREAVRLDEVLFYYRKHGFSMLDDARKPANIRFIRRRIRENHRELFRRHRWALWMDRMRWFWMRHCVAPERWN